MPRVSVLLPAYDAEATLRAALRSVERQTERDWECIVVDDGSRDGTAEIAHAFAERDRRFRVLSRPHAGLVESLNAGLGMCASPVVARMDADDLMHRERLRLQCDAIDAGLDAAGCRVRLFPRLSLLAGLREYETWLNGVTDPRRDAFVECPIAHPALAIRRELASYRDRGWPEDYDLILRVILDGKRVGIVPKRLLSWRDGPARLSRTDPAYALERFAACKAHFLSRSFLAGHDAYHLWGFGSTGKLLRTALLAEGKRPDRIFELHPRRLGNVIDGAPVVPPDTLAAAPKLPVVVCIAGVAGREAARADLASRGLVELRDFVCAS